MENFALEDTLFHLPNVNLEKKLSLKKNLINLYFYGS